ncbi:MAG: ribonuclease [Patescibacteria group bacterium]|nr:ribonuclease [Patescibacteria group bacterium]
MLDLKTEKEIMKAGYPLIAGIDEAGRGPLAGPVVAACVIIDANFNLNDQDLTLVTDSKKLSPTKRNALFKIIKDKVLAVEIGVVNNDVIDKINILQASFLAMRHSLKKIPLKPDFILVDGKYPIPRITTPQKAIIGGDSNTWVIAAASIIAKVSRDWLMTEFHKEYPQYNFKKHKGYGTKEHLQALAQFGPCPLHRRSFAPLKKIN